MSNNIGDSNFQGNANPQQGFGVKKSQFLGNGTNPIPESATFDFVQGGMNIKVTFTDLKAQLGVTGSLSPTPAGVPVLDGGPTAFTIRSIESGRGILATTSPQNGITISENITADTTGAATLVKDLTTTTARSILPGNGINVGEAGNTITISLTSGDPVSIKTVNITQESDFPDPISGVITLDDATDYLIQNDISTTSRFVMGAGSQIRGVGANLIQLEYTGSGTMFTGVDTTFGVQNISISCPSGTVLDFSNSGGSEGTNTFYAQDATFFADQMGTFTSGRSLVFEDCGFFLTTDGFTIAGTGISNIFFNSMIIDIAAGTFLDLGTIVAPLIRVEEFSAELGGGATLLAGLPSSGNISPTGQGLVTNGLFSTTGTILSGIGVDDARWGYFGNNLLQDSRTDGLTSTLNNAVASNIVGANTPVKAAGVFAVFRSSRMTGDATGRLTYDRVSDEPLPITASATMRTAGGGGGGDKCAVYIAINGVPVQESRAIVDVNNTVDATVACVWQHLFSQNDYVELWVANLDNGTDIVVEDAVLRVN